MIISPYQYGKKEWRPLSKKRRDMARYKGYGSYPFHIWTG
jgi:hypothetical protein